MYLNKHYVYTVLLVKHMNELLNEVVNVDTFNSGCMVLLLMIKKDIVSTFPFPNQVQTVYSVTLLLTPFSKR